MGCTNEDHRSVIYFRVGRMHWQPAARRNEANCRRSIYGDGGHDDLSHRRGLRYLGPIADHCHPDAPKYTA